LNLSQHEVLNLARALPVGKSEVRRAIMAEDKRLRAKYKFLAHQDLIGGAIVAASVVFNSALALGYMMGIIPAVMAVVGIAIGLSILHEIEHDLIHNLYFAGNRRLQHAVFWLIWILKLHANPIWRRKAHLRHHAKSGQLGDWEERLLGLGDRLGWRRLSAILHPFGSVVYMDEIADTDPEFDPRRTSNSSLLTAIVFCVLSGLGILNLVLPESSHQMFSDDVWNIISTLNVVWVLPGMLRHTAITIMTTSVHYFGDIPAGDVLYENQIVDHWLALPVQLFCFNFGATHVIHHFVAAQPFYLRQMVAPRVKPVLLAAGVRHNDLAILNRANRWNVLTEDANAA